MIFAHLIGHEGIKKQLQRLLDQGKVPQTLLFYGLEGVGKSLFAKALAAALIQSPLDRGHPDVKELKPEGKLALHTMAAIRRLQEEISTSPYSAPCKVFIIHDADRLPLYASNALLKILEEPPIDSYFILLSKNLEGLLDTVLSRCFRFQFFPLSDQEVGKALQKAGCSEELAVTIAKRADGSLAKAKRLLSPLYLELETWLFPLLIGPHSYLEVVSVVEAIDGLFGKWRQQYEEEEKKRLSDFYPEQDAASLEKMVESFVSLQMSVHIADLLAIVEGFYRDLELLRCDGNESLALANPTHLHRMRQVSSNPTLSLDKVLTLIEKISAAYSRSLSLNCCLQDLFLELQCSTQIP